DVRLLVEARKHDRKAREAGRGGTTGLGPRRRHLTVPAAGEELRDSFGCHAQEPARRSVCVGYAGVSVRLAAQPSRKVTRVATTYAQKMSVASSSRLSPPIAASGSTHTTYQGKSHAVVASSASVAHPAGAIQPPGS